MRCWTFRDVIYFTQPYPSASNIRSPFPSEPHESSAGYRLSRRRRDHPSVSHDSDLLGRYGDIIGLSFDSNCVMRFDRAEPNTQSDKNIEEFQDKSSQWDLYLTERSILSFFLGLGRHRDGTIGPME
jgi:hypothetical protein